MEDNMMSASEVMDTLGITRPKLYRLIRDGKLRASEKNPLNSRRSRLMINREDVEKLLEEIEASKGE